MSARVARPVAFALLVGLASGCGDQPSRHSFPMEAHARDDSGRPVARLRLHVDGKPVGHTGADGKLETVLRGRDGDRLRVRAEPPPTHRLLGAQEVHVVLQRATALGGGRAQSQVVRIPIRLAPRQRRYAILVLTDGHANLPIRVDERPVGQTDAWGVTQLLHEGPPGGSIAVVIDTGLRPNLRPSNPTRVFGLADHDDILLFQQDFRVERPADRRSASRRRRARLRRLRSARP